MPILGGEKPVTPPAYTTYQHGPNYYADPSIESGKTRLSGTVAQSVIQAAINALTSGLVYIKGASYGPVSVTAKDGVDIWIDKGATTISVAVPNPYNGTIFDMQTRAISMYKSVGGATYLVLHLDGNTSSLQLGYLKSDAKLKLDRVAIKNWESDARFIDEQSETSNEITIHRIMPKGTPAGNVTRAGYQIFATDAEADPSNYEALEIVSEVVAGTPTFHINSFKAGTGTIRPMNFRIDGILFFQISTGGDIEVTNWGKGIILTNAAGNIRQRARLNDAGDGWIFETP